MDQKISGHRNCRNGDISGSTTRRNSVKSIMSIDSKRVIFNPQKPLPVGSLFSLFNVIVLSCRLISSSFLTCICSAASCKIYSWKQGHSSHVFPFLTYCTFYFSFPHIGRSLPFLRLFEHTLTCPHWHINHAIFYNY